MAAPVYVLCLLTSLACATLLFRAFKQSRVRLLLWSSLCFLGLAGNNALLLVDRVMLPTQIDLVAVRSLPALLGLLLLLYGLIWDAD